MHPFDGGKKKSFDVCFSIDPASAFDNFQFIHPFTPIFKRFEDLRLGRF
jgi:hypothetical protein